MSRVGLGNVKMALKPFTEKEKIPPSIEDARRLNPYWFPCANCQAKRDNKWNKINSLQRQLDSELDNTERTLSVLKERLASLPEKLSKPNDPSSGS